MANSGQLDPRVLIFPITKPPPTSWSNVSLVQGRLSRHWSLIRGLIEEQKKARKNRSISNARLSANLFREVVTRLSLSLEAVDTNDKFNATPGVGDMIHKAGEKYLKAQVTARNDRHVPPTKTFISSAAAILVAMSREAESRALNEVEGGEKEDVTVWLSGQQVRTMAAPLCEEDLGHRGDEIILGEVENFAWCTMAHLCNDAKFGCVRKKDLDEKSTIAKLEGLGRRPVCRTPGCEAYATKCAEDLSDRVKLATFFRSVYCKEHHEEIRGEGKRKKKRGKGKEKSEAVDQIFLDASPLRGGDLDVGTIMNPSPTPRAAVSGKIKADWYRRVLGEALLNAELDRVERSEGADIANRLTAPWRKEFIKNASNVYALTLNGQWIARKLEKALTSGKGGPATASPILNRASYASFSERDGGGGGGTGASPHNGHSPLAPTRANGAAKPGVRLLIDNREKRGMTRNSQLSELTNFLNSRNVPYEVRELKTGDYGWVVQPDAGRCPLAGEVGYEREFVVPRLLERKRVDDLAESIKDGRLLRQKKAMLHARDSGLLSDIEIHLEGGTRDARYIDEIGRRGLSPADLEATLEQAVGDGFKVVHHQNFADFGAYLATATLALQKDFDSNKLAFESYCTWQNFRLFCKSQEPLKPNTAAAVAASAAVKAAHGGIIQRGRPQAEGKPPLPPISGGMRHGFRQRTLNVAFGVKGRPGTASPGQHLSGVAEAVSNIFASDGTGRAREDGNHRGGRHEEVDSDSGAASDSSGSCSIVEVRQGAADSGCVAASGDSNNGASVTSLSTVTAKKKTVGGPPLPFQLSALEETMLEKKEHSPQQIGIHISTGRCSSRQRKRLRLGADEFPEGKESDRYDDDDGSIYSDHGVAGGGLCGTRPPAAKKKARSLCFVDQDLDSNDLDIASNGSEILQGTASVGSFRSLLLSGAPTGLVDVASTRGCPLQKMAEGDAAAAPSTVASAKAPFRKGCMVDSRERFTAASCARLCGRQGSSITLVAAPPLAPLIGMLSARGNDPSAVLKDDVIDLSLESPSPPPRQSCLRKTVRKKQMH